MIAKRLLDLMLVIPGIVVFSPVMIVIAIWVRMDSPGGSIYRQDRVGRSGRSFGLLKFRTMVRGADRMGERVTVGGDPRITRCGAFLRRYKLDELPQLFNVLGGTMSLVGPRPEVAEFVAQYPPAARDKILSVRPGITDNAAIEFRNENELLRDADDPRRFYIECILPRKLTLYEQYVDNRTIWLDIKLILRTVIAIAR